MWNYINNQDKENLKKLFKEIIKTTEVSTKKEAVKEAKRYILNNWEGIKNQYQADYIGSSAEGISVFYGADSPDTVVAEIYNSAYFDATVVAFKNTRELVILDLTKLDNDGLPSLFDEERRHLREPYFFLSELLKDLTRPIETMHSIEYIPAQVVAEYFRYVHRNDGKRIDGITYKSSRVKDGVCYVLFVTHKECLPQEQLSIFNDYNYQILEMDKSSLKTYKVKNQIELKEI